MKKIKVHVADDHKILIDGIIAVIKTDENIEVTGFSLTGKDVIEHFKLKRNLIDVLILDINMPEVDGIEVLRYFKTNKILQKIIVLSSLDDVQIVQEVLNLGCYGYITKKYAATNILDAIKTVANGEQYLSNDIKQILIKSFSNLSEDNIDTEKVEFEALSEKELDVLRYIVQEYSSGEIASIMDISINTVDTYRKRLYKKLNVKSSVGLAMYALKNRLI